MSRRIIIGLVVAAIGILLLLIHDYRWGHPFAHGDSLGCGGLVLLMVGAGIFGVTLWKIWRGKR